MQLCNITKVFDNSMHNAFTSITWFRGLPYIAFRCGTAHDSADGRVLVLRGDREGRRWLPVAALWAGIDTRDPKLLVAPDGLYVYCFTHRTDTDEVGSGYVVSHDGDNWGPWTTVQNNWVYWRPEWFGDAAYVAAYHHTPYQSEGPVVLKRSVDARHWEDVCTLVDDERRQANETALSLAPDGRMWAIVRSEHGSELPLLGWATAPFTDWHFEELSIKLQGPYLWRVGQSLYLSGRWFQPSGLYNTAVFRMEEGRPVPQLVLPSAGDTSYMGAVPADPEDTSKAGRWWLSYYSAHENLALGFKNFAAIYLAEVELD